MKNTLYTRIKNKSETTSGVVPTIPLTDDHGDGSWRRSDVYSAEFFVNITDKRLWQRMDATLVEVATSESNASIGSIERLDAGKFANLSQGRQNLTYGDLTVGGTLTNAGVIMIVNGNLRILSAGTIIGAGDIKFKTTI